MGFKFRKSIKIAPGVKLNFNKKSTGITFGGKGMHYTVNSKGKRTTSVGVPGTGLYYSTTSSKSKNLNRKTSGNSSVNGIAGGQNYNNNYNGGNENMNNKKWYQQTWGVVLMLVLFFPMGLYLMWKHAQWGKGVKIGVTSALVVLCALAGSGDSADEPPTSLAFDGNTTSVTISETSDLFEDITSEITTTETTTEEETTEEETTEEETTEEETTEEETTEEETTEEETTEEETTEEEITEEETYYDDTYYDEEEDDTYYGEEESEMVWITATGTKYHSIPDCGNTKSSRQVSLETAKRNYSACSKCW